MANRLRKILLMILCLQTGILCAGCWRAREENRVSRADAIIKSGHESVVRRKTPYANVDLTDTTVTDSSADASDMNASSAELHAKSISQGVTKIDGIKKASVVVSGNIAIVGIETDISQDDTRLIKLKQSVEKEVKSIEPTIQHVAVTSAPDLVKRIIDMDGQTSSAQ